MGDLLRLALQLDVLHRVTNLIAIEPLLHAIRLCRLIFPWACFGLQLQVFNLVLECIRLHPRHLNIVVHLTC